MPPTFWPDRLDGPRLTLRPFRIEDAGPLFEAVESSREHLRAFLPWEQRMRCVADEERFIAEQTSPPVCDSTVPCVALERAGGRVVGCASLFHVELINGTAELGYWIRADSLNRGYAGEASRLLLEFAFDRLRIHRVEVRADTLNRASLRVIEKLGFRREGVLRDCKNHFGERRSHAVASMLVHERL